MSGPARGPVTRRDSACTRPHAATVALFSREPARSATSSEARPCLGLVCRATFRSGTGERQEGPHAREDTASLGRGRVRTRFPRPTKPPKLEDHISESSLMSIQVSLTHSWHVTVRPASRYVLCEGNTTEAQCPPVSPLRHPLAAQAEHAHDGASMVRSPGRAPGHSESWSVSQ